MQYLEEGKTYHNKDMADWFGMSSDGSFRNQKKKKLEELKDFADFEEVKGKIKINKVYIAEYSKNIDRIKKNIDDDFYDELTPYNGGYLDTMTAVSDRIQSKHEVNMNISQSYHTNLVRQKRMEEFGKPGNLHQITKKGACEYCWAAKTEEGDIVPLNQEQKEILSSYFKSYAINELDMAAILATEELGVITAEEAFQMLKDRVKEQTGGKKIQDTIMEIKEKYNWTLVRATYMYETGWLEG